ncbi:hypothetical protein PC39_02220 [Salinisphaera sp. PC39]|uniref:hypothetical protein n=1 Tax=Salinisphaera sp. PC39 TaxID=1304156 RepID=UPI00333E7C32
MRIKTHLISVLTGMGMFALGMGSAVAQPQLPPPGDYTLTGTLTVYSAGIQGGECASEAGVSITNSSNGTLNSLDFSGSGVCADAAVTSVPNALVKSGNTITAQNLNVSTSVGDCTGNLDGSLTVSGGVTQVVYTQANSTLSGGLFGLGCAIEGSLDF